MDLRAKLSNDDITAARAAAPVLAHATTPQLCAVALRFLAYMADHPYLTNWLDAQPPPETLEQQRKRAAEARGRQLKGLPALRKRAKT